MGKHRKTSKENEFETEKLASKSRQIKKEKPSKQFKGKEIVVEMKKLKQIKEENMPKLGKRMQTRPARAASKEALKNMHMMLDRSAPLEVLEIDDDDNEFQVGRIEPPKKKYKASLQRKSADGTDRDVLVLKTITNHHSDNALELNCWVEDLSAIQREMKQKYLREEAELQQKLNALLSGTNVQLIHKGDLTTALELTDVPPKQPAAGAVAGQNIVLNNTATSNYQLVMDPRLGLIAIPGTQKQFGSKTVQINATQPPPMRALKRKAGRGAAAAAAAAAAATTASTPTFATPAPPLPHKPTILNKALLKNVQPISARQSGTYLLNSQTKPSESNVVGGLATGHRGKRNPGVVDLTSEERNAPDSKEISFNKLQGKTYPSLVVVARPHLKVTDPTTDRAKLDAKVKSVLMCPPAKFTEWLIQQGLIRSEQRCAVHANVTLKLGMYSDVTKFPFSGGYVWISECCPQRFVSVFSGSVFEGAPHPPIAILKLLYHWACQTNIQNVTQWVKVDNLYVKGIYTWLRAICTCAVHTHLPQLGGPGIRVEVGVISLGTTSQDGNQRQVKVEVLGILETASKRIRLRAVEPTEDRNYRKRFSKILEPIVQWVHPSSTIVTDLTVDKATLQSMGFNHIIQNTNNSDYFNSNCSIMEYLRRIVPRMFQNTLSLLSRQIIQQFLDELVWREWFGTTSLEAFDNIVAHLAEKTRYELGNSFFTQLNKVAVNPFKNWAMDFRPNTEVQQVAHSVTPATQKKYTRRKEPAARKEAPSPARKEDLPSISPDGQEQLVPLENYYYGTILRRQVPNNVVLNVKCPLCKVTIDNNIKLMSHLFKHVHNASDNSLLCRYCLSVAYTTHDLQDHIINAHPDKTKCGSWFVCLICESKYKNAFTLGKHMSRTHRPSELPYSCGTCGYRCSNHKAAIDHFYRIHNNAATIQCPFCLKSAMVNTGGRNTLQNINFFIQHLSKHQKKALAKKCNRCNLWFVQKDLLKAHAEMHFSMRGKPGLKPSAMTRVGIVVPKSELDKSPTDGESIDFNSLVLNLPAGTQCFECGTPMGTSKHFSSLLQCEKSGCLYTTCCSKAMKKHNNCNQVCEEQLPQEMHCVCGYKSSDGNLLAKHLALCERKSAYPSVESASAATVTQSMLNVLGLVRKPEEKPKSSTSSAMEIEEDAPICLDDENDNQDNDDLFSALTNVSVEMEQDSKNDIEIEIEPSTSIDAAMDVDPSEPSTSTGRRGSSEEAEIIKDSEQDKEKDEAKDSEKDGAEQKEDENEQNEDESQKYETEQKEDENEQNEETGQKENENEQKDDEPQQKEDEINQKDDSTEKNEESAPESQKEDETAVESEETEVATEQTDESQTKDDKESEDSNLDVPDNKSGTEETNTEETVAKTPEATKETESEDKNEDIDNINFENQ